MILGMSSLNIALIVIWVLCVCYGLWQLATRDLTAGRRVGMVLGMIGGSLGLIDLLSR